MLFNQHMENSNQLYNTIEDRKHDLKKIEKAKKIRKPGSYLSFLAVALAVTAY